MSTNKHSCKTSPCKHLQHTSSASLDTFLYTKYLVNLEQLKNPPQCIMAERKQFLNKHRTRWIMAGRKQFLWQRQGKKDREKETENGREVSGNNLPIMAGTKKFFLKVKNPMDNGREETVFKKVKNPMDNDREETVFKKVLSMPLCVFGTWCWPPYRPILPWVIWWISRLLHWLL